jgi:hypothetical protein
MSWKNALLLVLVTVAILLLGLQYNYLQVAIGFIATLSAIAAILKLHTSGPKIALELDNNKQALGHVGGDVYLGWIVKFTFTNDGERNGRVFDSHAKVVLSSQVENIVPQIVGFGPNGVEDFMIAPDTSVTGSVTLGLDAQTRGPRWMDKYVEAVKAGRLLVMVEISWKYGDTAKRNVKVQPVTVLDAQLFRGKK